MDESTTKKYRVAMQELRKANETIKERDLTIELKSKHIEEISTELKAQNDKWDLIQKGALVYTTDLNGYVDSMVNIPSEFKTTYPQVILEAFDTKLYHANRFIKIENGIITIDEEKYNEYKRRLIL